MQLSRFLPVVVGLVLSAPLAAQPRASLPARSTDQTVSVTKEEARASATADGRASFGSVLRLSMKGPRSPWLRNAWRALGGKHPTALTAIDAPLRKASARLPA
jgi:hypothetical protein